MSYYAEDHITLNQYSDRYRYYPETPPLQTDWLRDDEEKRKFLFLIVLLNNSERVTIISLIISIQVIDKTVPPRLPEQGEKEGREGKGQASFVIPSLTL